MGVPRRTSCFQKACSLTKSRRSQCVGVGVEVVEAIEVLCPGSGVVCDVRCAPSRSLAATPSARAL